MESNISLKNKVTIDKDVFACLICTNMALDAYECLTCATIICNQCYTLHTKNSKTCPMCRKDLHYRPSLVLRKVISSIETVCPLYCGHISILADIKFHILNSHSKEEINADVYQSLINDFNIRIFEDHQDLIKNFLFHMHPLEKVPVKEGWACKGEILFKDKNICLTNNKDSKYRYRCFDCDYDLCANCVKYADENKITSFSISKYHPHNVNYIIRDNGWSCDGRKLFESCKTNLNVFHESRGHKRFRCEICDFDLCEKCLLHALANK